jgi:hypothetical protein
MPKEKKDGRARERLTQLVEYAVYTGKVDSSSLSALKKKLFVDLYKYLSFQFLGFNQIRSKL